MCQSMVALSVNSLDSTIFILSDPKALWKAMEQLIILQPESQNTCRHKDFWGLIGIPVGRDQGEECSEKIIKLKPDHKIARRYIHLAAVAYKYLTASWAKSYHGKDQED